MSKSIYGLVLCGGKSSRMGTAKSRLNYHGKPQLIFLYEMLHQICDTVFISCSKEQSYSIPPDYDFIVDVEKYSATGPLSGLLSAFEMHPDKSFLIVGCDYPFIKIDDLKKLINARTKNHLAVCYFNPETKITEPLITVYENECYPLLLANFIKGKKSLRVFLDEINSVKIIPENILSLKSVDTFEEYQSTLS